MIKKCSKCEATFTCKNDARGCWCENINLSTQLLAYLKENYENCLCPKCLKEFEKLNKSPVQGTNDKI
jgi:hypothetical protein